MVKVKLIIFATILIGSTSPDCNKPIIYENLQTLEIECPELLENTSVCVAVYGNCSRSLEKLTTCNSAFTKCTDIMKSNKLSPACQLFLSNTTDQVLKNGGNCLEKQFEEAYEVAQNEFKPFIKMLYNETTARSFSGKRRSGNFGSINDIVELLIGFIKKPNVNYWEDAEELEKALLAVEEKNTRYLGISFLFWHGGFGQKQLNPGKVIDRALVRICCGPEVAPKINHAYAVCSNCLSRTKNISCINQLINTLNETAVESIKGYQVCNMYVKVVQSYKQMILERPTEDPFFEYLDVRHISSQDVTPAMLRSNKRYILYNSRSIYEKCTSDKDTVSSCEHNYQKCKIESRDCEKKDCDKKRLECISNIPDKVCREARLQDIIVSQNFSILFFLIICFSSSSLLLLSGYFFWKKYSEKSATPQEQPVDEAEPDSPGIIQAAPANNQEEEPVAVVASSPRIWERIWVTIYANGDSIRTRLRNFWHRYTRVSTGDDAQANNNNDNDQANQAKELEERERRAKKRNIWSRLRSGFNW